MIMLIENKRRAYAVAKRTWIWFSAASALSIVLSVIPMFLPDVWCRPFPALALVLAVATVALRWRADMQYQQAEALRRLQLFIDALGEAPDQTDLAVTLSNAGNTACDEPASIGPYYGSKEKQRWRRLVDNVRESAFYTAANSRTFFNYLCAGIIAFLVIMFVALYVSTVLVEPTLLASGVLAGVTAVIGTSIADVARSYFNLSNAAAAVRDTCRDLLRARSVPMREALQVVSRYDVALAGSPPIPGFVYKQSQARLDASWKAWKGGV